jgi:CheY-like chemotaxis protein
MGPLPLTAEGCAAVAKLLVVEDDLELAESLGSVLQDEGHEVRIARDGKEGLARIAEEMPDVVLLDVEMPILSGPDMAYQMFVTNCGKERIPIVFLSGVAELKGIAEQAGTPYFQTKPYRIQQVVALTQRALDERRPPVPRMRGRP